MFNALYEIGKRFKNNPVGFAKVVLGVQLSKDQEHILDLLCKKPHKVLVRSANTQGKSYIASIAALYTFCCYNPSITLITAPVYRQISDIIFKEIRSQGTLFQSLFLPKAPVLFDNPKHQIVGITASTATSFQGLHGTTISAIVDEAVGVEKEFIEALEPMVAGDGHYTLLLYNPTDSSAYPYQLERYAKSHLVVLNALNHPNIEAELKGELPPFPNAIRLERLREMIDLWCDETNDITPEAFTFDGKLYQPSPVAQARLLGMWPSQASNAVWSHALFEKCINNVCPREGHIQIGHDSAAFGDDDSATAVRHGKHVIHMEHHNGWSPQQQVNRLKELSTQFRLNPPDKPPIVIDEGGVGMAVSQYGDDFNFLGINFSSSSRKPNEFANMRGELHFHLADEARKGNVSFNLLPKDQQELLRMELLAPTYSLDSQGRRIVEAKKDIKKRLGKSPDIAESVMLAFNQVYCDNFKVSPPNVTKQTRKLGF